MIPIGVIALTILLWTTGQKPTAAFIFIAGCIATLLTNGAA